MKAMEMDKYLELKEKFEANRDDENAVKMAAYMRNLFSFYGLPTPKRKAIYKDLANSFILKLTSVSKCNFKSFFFLCHVYFSFFQALNLNFPVIQTENCLFLFFRF